VKVVVDELRTGLYYKTLKYHVCSNFEHLCISAVAFLVTIGEVGMAPLRSSLRKFPEFAGIIHSNCSFEKKKFTISSFVALGMRSEGNAPKSAELTADFSFVTMLQHTGRFWSRQFMEIILYIIPKIFRNIRQLTVFRLKFEVP
jgi:hypothetical protein